MSNTSSSFFREEINTLNEERTKIEEEMAALKRGEISLDLGGERTVEMAVELPVVLSEDLEADREAIHQQYALNLAENTIGQELVKAQQKEDELREEYGLPAAPKGIIGVNRSINKVATKKGLKFVSSPWLLLAGIILMVLGILLFGSSSKKVTTNPASISPDNLSPDHPVYSTSASLNVSDPSQALAGRASFSQVRFMPMVEETPSDTNNPTPTPLATTQTDNPTPRPTLTDEQWSNRVGQPPGAAGGLNGAHGAFFAPSSLIITALNLTSPIVRAITSEQGGVLSINFPRPGEVSHYGAYPCEIGNMVLMASSSTLGSVRRLQINDEIKIIDRRGSVCVYRIIPFSPSGQPEREVDLKEDAWLFDPTNDHAFMTLIVGYPQTPLVLSGQATGQNAQAGVPEDDYTTTKRLAYRAALAFYAPAPVGTPQGVPVNVPAGVWQVRPANTPTPVPPTATPQPMAVAPEPTNPSTSLTKS